MAKRLPDHWKQTYCTLIAEGYTRSDAAKATGVAIGTVDRHQSEDPEFRELYVQARESVRDTLRNDIWKLRHSENDSTARWAYDHLIKWNLPEAKDTQRLEITTPPQAIEGRRPVGLADVFRLAQDLGIRIAVGVDASNPRPALSAAPDVLPDPPEDQ